MGDDVVKMTVVKDYNDHWTLESEYTHNGLHMFFRNGWDVMELHRFPRNWVCVL